MPHRLAGVRFDCRDRAICAADDNQARAVDRRDDGCRINSIERAASGRAGPNTFARPFVKSVEAVAAQRRIAPAVNDRADDNQIAFDDRRSGAPALRCPSPKLFRQRTAPEHFAVIGEGRQFIARAEGVDIARRRIADGR